MKTGHAKACPGVVVDLTGYGISSYQEGIELDSALGQLLFYGTQQEATTQPGKRQLCPYISEEGLVKVGVLMLGIVDHNTEKDNGATDDAGNNGIGKFIEPGFLIHGVVRPYQAKENKPGQGYQQESFPEWLAEHQPMLFGINSLM